MPPVEPGTGPGRARDFCVIISSHINGVIFSNKLVVGIQRFKKKYVCICVYVCLCACMHTPVKARG